jgi:hypothetical protein
VNEAVARVLRFLCETETMCSNVEVEWKIISWNRFTDDVG